MKEIKRKDIIFIILTVILCIVSINIYRVKSKEGRVLAQIFYDNRLVKEVDLSSKNPQEIILAQATEVVIIYDGKGNIYFEKSNCSDKVCVNAKNLSTPPQMAACLPNRIIVKVVSKKENNNSPDVVA